MLPLAAIATPNQFEAELLSGIAIGADGGGAAAACDALHALGPRTVVVKVDGGGPPGTLAVYCSTPRRCVADSPLWAGEGAGGAAGAGDDGDSRARFVVTFPALPGVFHGTGDLMAALILACVGRAAAVALWV